MARKIKTKGYKKTVQTYVLESDQLEFKEFVTYLVKDMNYKGSSYSKLCVAGAKIIIDVFEGLDEKQAKNIESFEELEKIIRNKLELN